MASKTQLSVECDKPKSHYKQIFHRQFYGDRPHTTQMPKTRRIHTCSSTANTAMKWSECWLNGADDWYGTGTEHKWQISIRYVSHKVGFQKLPPLPPHPPPTLLGTWAQFSIAQSLNTLYTLHRLWLAHVIPVTQQTLASLGILTHQSRRAISWHCRFCLTENTLHLHGVFVFVRRYYAIT